jgi:hypothetical protein
VSERFFEAIEAANGNVFCLCPDPPSVEIIANHGDNTCIPICDGCDKIIDAEKYETITAVYRAARLRFEIKRSKTTKRWTWELFAPDGKSMKKSDKSYGSKIKCISAMLWVEGCEGAYSVEAENE